ncbi:hypothetical protein CAEBREN_00430 [Caenorhabditis brenneri]|uniref:Uncharacterized protein n=1 Tax=Caenorhabditis brenneri TaxID=135651 RepID=G0MF81_CAEBE|nr:hypothetical protein CAEBREN_00430 [Caenorhabditis brenneri]
MQPRYRGFPQFVQFDKKQIYFEKNKATLDSNENMENDRSSDKITPKKEEDEPMPMSDDDDLLYVTANDQTAGGGAGQITINLERDMKRKITIITEPEQPKRPRRTGSVDLRRQAIMNSAIRSAQSASRSRSRSRSRNRSRSRGRSLTRARSTSGDGRRSRSRGRAQSIPVQRRVSKSPVKPLTPFIRLPTDLSNKSVIGKNATGPPSHIELPSPLFILTEQQITGASEKKTVQFVTKILLTTQKLSLDERRNLYSEMVEAEYIGTSRSSTDLNKSADDEPEEGYELKIYYSSKGVYIHSIQNVRKVRNGKQSKVSEEKTYSNICMTRIIGDHGKMSDGFLNITCSETISAVNQSYQRDENFKIGLKSCNVAGNVSIKSQKTTFDPTKTTNFYEAVTFDNKNVGIEVQHTATADMKEIWEHEMGSFGEEQSEYREIKFFFEDEKEEKKERTPGAAVTSVIQTPKASGSGSTSGSASKASGEGFGTTGAANTAAASGSASESTSSKSKSGSSSRRSRSRAKRHRAIKKASDSALRNNSPDRQSTRKETRPDQEPIKLNLMDVSNDSSMYYSFPRATSTPKSPGATSRRGAISIREHAEKHSDNEVDLDKSLSQKSKTPASKNLSQIVAERIEEARKKDAASMVSKPPLSPSVNSVNSESKNQNLTGTSVYLYNTKSSTPKSTHLMTAQDLREDRIRAHSTSPGGPALRNTTPSPQNILRVKETKVTREVRQEDGKPAEIQEKTEETVKEQKVKLEKTSPATPKMKQSFHQMTATNVVTLSALKETHQSLDVTPINVDAITESSSTGSSSTATASSSGQLAFKEDFQLDMLIDKKRFVLNVNFLFLGSKQPEVEIGAFSFRGQKLWEKSSEWPLSSANTTSHTKTLAVQASDIMEQQAKDGEEKK